MYHANINQKEAGVAILNESSRFQNQQYNKGLKRNIL